MKTLLDLGFATFFRKRRAGMQTSVSICDDMQKASGISCYAVDLHCRTARPHAIHCYWGGFPEGCFSSGAGQLESGAAVLCQSIVHAMRTGSIYVTGALGAVGVRPPAFTSVGTLTWQPRSDCVWRDAMPPASVTNRASGRGLLPLGRAWLQRCLKLRSTRSPRAW